MNANGHGGSGGGGGWGEGCTALDIITTMELYAQNR